MSESAQRAEGTDVTGSASAGTAPLERVHVALVLAMSTGGVGRHVRSLAAGLLDGGATVTVLGPEGTDTRFGFSSLGARFRPVDIPPSAHPKAVAHAAVRLRKLLRGAHLVHAHGLRAGFVTGLALRVPRGARIPYIVTWHNALLRDTSGGWRGRWPAALLGAATVRAAAWLADVTVGASPDLVDRARAAGARDARFIPVAAPALLACPAERSDVRAELGASERPLVVAVGRLGPQKDYPTLLDAAAEWARRDPAPLVAIVGEGPLHAQLDRRVQEEGLPVRLLGHREDVTDVLEACDVVAMPSLWEARSLVAQEALRAGRPLVASAVGGIPELVGDGALLVPPRDPRALAAAVARVLDDRALAARLGERGLAVARALPSEDAVVAELVALYEQRLRPAGT